MKKQNSKQKSSKKIMKIEMLFGLLVGIILFLNIFVTNTSGVGGPTCPPCWTGPSCSQRVCCDCYLCVPGLPYPPCLFLCDTPNCMQCVGVTGNCLCQLCGGKPNTTCCNGSCCDSNLCQTCVNGQCKVCGGDLCKVCVNGTCMPIKIKSETEATLPSDTTRTTIGIGEVVYCYTDPPAAVFWEHTGDGFIYPEGIPSYGVSYYAFQKPGSGCVHAKVGANECDTITFSVIEPSRMMVSLAYSDWSIGIPGPPNNLIGCSSNFKCIVQPTSVNFYNALFRENIPGETWTWPDGSIGNWSSRYVSWIVSEDDGQHNLTTDWCCEYFNSISRLWNGSMYIDHCHTIRVPEEYSNHYGTWTEWLSGENHPFQYIGSSQKGQANLDASNLAFGDLMGPWR